MKNIRMFVSLFLVFAMLTALLSCAETKTEESKTTETEKATETEEIETEKPYEVVDLNGEEINVFGTERFWEMNTVLLVDPETDAGEEALNEAIYKRNLWVEENFNVTLKESRYDIAATGAFDNYIALARSLITAGDDTYDCMYLNIRTATSFITDGSLYDLNKIDELKLEEEYWDQLIVNAAKIKDKVYFATSPAHMMATDCCWCLFFNEELIDEFNLEMPYESVKDGSWTIDKFFEYAVAGTQINGDSAEWVDGNTNIYGISAHPYFPMHCMVGLNQPYIIAQGDEFISNYTTEKFFDTFDKIQQTLITDCTLWAETTDSLDISEGGYLAVFANHQALFLTGEVKASLQLRSMDDTFGILPLPKYDENQEEYISSTTRDFLSFTIPVTNKHPEIVATVFDAMSYKGYESVLPVYYETTVEQKGLRNEESLEMLQYIKDGKTVDPGILFAFCSDLSTSMQTILWTDKAVTKSTITSAESKITASIEKFLSFYADEE